MRVGHSTRFTPSGAFWTHMYEINSKITTGVGPVESWQWKGSVQCRRSELHLLWFCSATVYDDADSLEFNAGTFTRNNSIVWRNGTDLSCTMAPEENTHTVRVCLDDKHHYDFDSSSFYKNNCTCAVYPKNSMYLRIFCTYLYKSFQKHISVPAKPSQDTVMKIYVAGV